MWTMGRIAIILIFFLIMVGTAAALNPVNVAVASSNSWITANNTDSTDIMVTVTDGSNKAIGGRAFYSVSPSPGASRILRV